MYLAAPLKGPCGKPAIWQLTKESKTGIIESKCISPVNPMKGWCKAMDLKAAIEYWQQEFETQETELLLLHGARAIIENSTSEEEKKKAGAAALAIAQKVAEKANYKNIAFEKAIDKDPAKRIIDLAKEIEADTIVMGNRGLGTAGAFLLGSVSTAVVKHSPCPVFVIK